MRRPKHYVAHTFYVVYKMCTHSETTWTTWTTNNPALVLCILATFPCLHAQTVRKHSLFGVNVSIKYAVCLYSSVRYVRTLQTIMWTLFVPTQNSNILLLSDCDEFPLLSTHLPLRSFSVANRSFPHQPWATNTTMAHHYMHGCSYGTFPMWCGSAMNPAECHG